MRLTLELRRREASALNDWLGLTIAHAISGANYLIELEPNCAVASVVANKDNGIVAAGGASKAGLAGDTSKKICPRGARGNTAAEG